MQLKLVKTRDIAASLGQRKKANQILVGFALETQNEIENASQKVVKKNLDFVVLNSLRDEGAGFGVDTNQVSLVYKGGRHEKLSLKSKEMVAVDIIDAILAL